MSFSHYFTQHMNNGICNLRDVIIQVKPVPGHQAISAQQIYDIETTSNQRRCDVRSHGRIDVDTRGRSRISGKGVHMYKGVGVRFALLILSHFFLNTP